MACTDGSEIAKTKRQRRKVRIVLREDIFVRFPNSNPNLLIAAVLNVAGTKRIETKPQGPAGNVTILGNAHLALEKEP